MLLMVFAMEAVKHVYEVRPRKDKRGLDLISDVLPFSRLHAGRSSSARCQVLQKCQVKTLDDPVFIRSVTLFKFSQTSTNVSLYKYEKSILV